jgi:hypothetical protein
MIRQIEATASDGLNRQGGDTGILMVHGTPIKYHHTPNSSTAEAYATAKLLTRFSMRVETARLVCRLSGLGGAQ